MQHECEQQHRVQQHQVHQQAHQAEALRAPHILQAHLLIVEEVIYLRHERLAIIPRIRTAIQQISILQHILWDTISIKG